jgi:hypothetical protein
MAWEISSLTASTMPPGGVPVLGADLNCSE